MGTDLLFSFGTKTAGAGAHHRQEQVRWDVVRALATGSLPGVLVGLGLLWILGAQSASAQKLMTTAVAAMVVTTGTLTLGGSFVTRHIGAAGKRALSSKARYAWTVGIGFVIGVLVALTSIGAGALCAVALLWLYREDMTTAERVGTDVAHAIPVTLLAGVGHLMAGHVNGSMLGGLLAGSVPMVLLGSWLASRLPEKALRTGLGLILLAVGGRLLF